MVSPDQVVPEDEARRAVEDISRRVGLLHMCYARTLVDELGEERGRELIRRAIWDYGTKIGEITRKRVLEQGFEPVPLNFDKGSDLSPIGFDHRKLEVDGEARTRTYSCAIAEIWRTYGEEDLGGLYCLVDPAKMKAYNPEWTMVHVKSVVAGDDFCEIAVRPVARSGGKAAS